MHKRVEQSNRVSARSFAIRLKADLEFFQAQMQLESADLNLDTKRVMGVVTEAMDLAGAVLNGCTSDGVVLLSVDKSRDFVIKVEWTGMPLIAEESFSRTVPPIVTANFLIERCVLRVAYS